MLLPLQFVLPVLSVWGQVMPWLDNVLEAHRKAVPAKSCGGQGSCGGEGGCKGATAELAMDWVLKNGIADAATIPYTGHAD